MIKSHKARGMKKRPFKFHYFNFQRFILSLLQTGRNLFSFPVLVGRICRYFELFLIGIAPFFGIPPIRAGIPPTFYFIPPNLLMIPPNFIFPSKKTLKKRKHCPHKCNSVFLIIDYFFGAAGTIGAWAGK